MVSTTDQQSGRRGFGPGSRGVWCTDSGPGAVRRLGQAGFDWVSLDMQHGTYGRAELLAVADPATADRFAARGVDCLAVATDLWTTAAGAARALGRDQRSGSAPRLGR